MKQNLMISGAIILAMLILWNIVDRTYAKFFASKKQIHLKFAKNLTQCIIVIIGLYNLGMRFTGFQSFSKSLLTSSSLLVVVLGFAFQTSLEDFIAGILISIFKPFNIDDRITLQDLNISGYIENITIRHTIVRTFTNNRLIVPNSIMNKAVIENTHMVDPETSNFMDVLITYDSDVDLAKEIMQLVISSHPSFIDSRSPQDIIDKKPKVRVFVRELAANGIALRASVRTSDVDTNFMACSEIRETLLKEFIKNGIQFAFPHTEVSGALKIEKDV